MAQLSGNKTLCEWEPETLRTYLIKVAGKLLTGNISQNACRSALSSGMGWHWLGIDPFLFYLNPLNYQSQLTLKVAVFIFHSQGCRRSGVEKVVS
jgi:hypothetical protein